MPTGPMMSGASPAAIWVASVSIGDLVVDELDLQFDGVLTGVEFLGDRLLGGDLLGLCAGAEADEPAHRHRFAGLWPGRADRAADR